ncbi:hypothetical protein HELRODRAFT_174123 [Helobdella robusta]|uniref:Uncharacterized protein n=1 Tax=Helobdella robusta TaxID=6412 RepID=T1F7N4_HELRO|nr:hypothetical protein HELRODRAFT_174123 [Helobdella robusta]ESO03223.1 hypothetical protein HELRODRAFT_174123 [Helobdella robusta]
MVLPTKNITIVLLLCFSVFQLFNNNHVYGSPLENRRRNVRSPQPLPYGCIPFKHRLSCLMGNGRRNFEKKENDLKTETRILHPSKAEHRDRKMKTSQPADYKKSAEHSDKFIYDTWSY